MVSWEPKGRLRRLKIFHWEPEGYYTGVLWQKEATLANEISRKWAKCICYVHWHQCNIMMSWLKYLSAGRVFLLPTRNGSKTCWVQSKNITFSDLGDLSVASFCQLLPFVRVGQYSCTKSMAIVPLWFSMEHLWTALMPFWLSADKILNAFLVCMTNSSLD